MDKSVDMPTVIVPACGSSTRFPGCPPKWKLTHPNGNLMILESVKGLPKNSRVVYVLLKEHLKDTDFHKKHNVVVLDQPTRNQPETIARAIESLGIVGSIYIKDVDNYFVTELPKGNFVSVSDARKIKHDVFQKSYIKSELGTIRNIVEKNVISDTFCCGGYGFGDAAEFLDYYEKNQHHDNLYLSHIIYDMMLGGHIFKSVDVEEYEDWGTLEAWESYKNEFQTVFIDLDGCLVENSSEWFFPKWGTSAGIQENIDTINKMHSGGKTHIIITTSRKSEYATATYIQLDRLGIKYHDVVFGLPHARRVLVNDFAPTNKYPTSLSVNLPRNSNNLKDYLK